MNADAIIKAAPELLKQGAELVGALKLTEIAKTILGPATGEFAERVKDEIRLYRFGRQLELLKKAEKMVEDAGFTPKAVPIKLLFPLLEGASLEENEDLHTMWAALLANASSPENSGSVRPGFITTLTQMASDEAILMNWICNQALEDGGSVDPTGVTVPFVNLGVCLDGLEAAQLIRRSDFQNKGMAKGLFGEDESNPSTETSFPFGPGPASTRAAVFADRKDKTYLLTDRGRAFVEACRPPKPKS